MQRRMGRIGKKRKGAKERQLEDDTPRPTKPNAGAEMRDLESYTLRGLIRVRDGD